MVGGKVYGGKIFWFWCYYGCLIWFCCCVECFDDFRIVGGVGNGF